MNVFESIMTNIRSVILNFRLLPLKKAARLPLRLYPGFRIIGLNRDNIILPEKLTRGMIFLGSPATPGLPGCSGGSIICGRDAVLKFSGPAYVRKGTTLRIDAGATIEVGGNVYINGNCFLRSDSSITIGYGCRIGWDVTINTTDGHSIIIDGETRKNSKPIEIEPHCWIGNRCTIAKGVTMSAGSVLAQCSLLTKTFPEKCLLGGVPAKIIKEAVEWK